MKKRRKEKSADLFNLIKSLTMQEKRYFTVLSQRHIIGEENKYIKLFNSINRQTVYDESALLKEFAGEKFSRNFNVAKKYLADLILKSLRLFYSKKTFQIEMRELLDHIEILIIKGQWKLCNKMIKKAKKTALDNELFSDYIQASDLEIQYRRATSDINWLKKQKEKTFIMEGRVMNKLNNFLLYRNLGLDGQVALSNADTSATKEKKVIFKKLLGDNILLEKKENALSDKALIYYYNNKGIYYETQGELKKSLVYFIQGAQFIMNSPNRLRQYIKAFIIANHNIILTCLNIGNFDKALYYLNKLKEIPAVYLLNNLNLVLRQYDLSLGFFVRQGNFKESIEFIKTMENRIETIKNKGAHKSLLFEIYYNMAYLYFGNGKFKNALKWCNEIEQEHTSDQQNYIFIYARILNVLINYESGNFDVISYKIRAAKRLLAKTGELHRTEKTVFDFLEKKIVKANTKNDLQNTFIKLKSIIMEYHIDKEEKNTSDYFDFIAWVDSKIQNRPFAEILKEKAG